MKTTVIYHSADFDGIFCREIARKFLGDQNVEYIGWDHGQPKINMEPGDGIYYILDLSPECLGGDIYDSSRIIWIDHHKSSIEKWPATISGYRIDGVAACRLAWQWFMLAQRKATGMITLLPGLARYTDRLVDEPLAVRLAGEYDIWDKRDPRAETFQFGLRARALDADDWAALLTSSEINADVDDLLDAGALLQRYQQQQDANLVNYRSFLVEFDGLKFLALNTARCNSLTFAAKDVPETQHDALMGFFYNGNHWKFSLYHAKHRTDLDLSRIAVKWGGGGHRGACGFQTKDALFNLGGKPQLQLLSIPNYHGTI